MPHGGGRKWEKEKAKTWHQPEVKLVSWEEASHNADSLLDRSSEETGAQVMMTGQQWAGPHLNHDRLRLADPWPST